MTAHSGLVENLQRWGAGKIIQLGNRTTVEHRTERLKQPESGLKIKMVSLNFPSGRIIKVHSPFQIVFFFSQTTFLIFPPKMVDSRIYISWIIDIQLVSEGGQHSDGWSFSLFLCREFSAPWQGCVVAELLSSVLADYSILCRILSIELT